MTPPGIKDAAAGAGVLGRTAAELLLEEGAAAAAKTTHEHPSPTGDQRFPPPRR
ncbi:MAG: hypothetical protein ACKVZ6_19995 [Kineosporiaceae bacterium]